MKKSYRYDVPIYTLAEAIEKAKKQVPGYNWNVYNDIILSTVIRYDIDHGCAAPTFRMKKIQQVPFCGYKLNHTAIMILEELAELFGCAKDGNIIECFNNVPIRILNCDGNYGGYVMDSVVFGNFMEDAFIFPKELIDSVHAKLKEQLSGDRK